MSRYNTEHVQLRMRKIGRCIRALSAVIVVMSAGQVGATLYIDSEDSDGSTYWIEEPCGTTISVSSEFNVEFQLIQNEVDLRDGAIAIPGLDGVHMLDLSEIGPEIQDVVISSHDGDVLLDNSSIFTPSGSISVTALESTPFGFDGLATGGAIIQVVGASIDGPSPVVPEPSTIALLVVGVVGVMVVRRRP